MTEEQATIMAKLKMAMKDVMLLETVKAEVDLHGAANMRAILPLLALDPDFSERDSRELALAMKYVEGRIAMDAFAQSVIPDPKIGIYQDYKGKYYFLQMIARHTETGEDMAVYTPLYAHHEGGRIPQIRPLKMFTEEVVFTDSVEIKMYGGERMPRFVFVGEKLPAAPKE